MALIVITLLDTDSGGTDVAVQCHPPISKDAANANLTGAQAIALHMLSNATVNMKEDLDALIAEGEALAEAEPDPL
jgi:hypothetical protein